MPTLIKKIRLTFTNIALGTASANPEIHREFIASKAPDPATIEDEVAAIGVDAKVEKSMTVFPKRDGKPFLYGYQFKGFLKHACSALARVPDTYSNKLKAYRKVIDGLVFVYPRESLLNLPAGTKIGDFQRPLRAETAQGPRICLANSETVPEGTTVDLEIKLKDEGHEKLLNEWLDYGADYGLLQWRNAGYGTFTWQELPADAK